MIWISGKSQSSEVSEIMTGTSIFSLIIDIQEHQVFQICFVAKKDNTDIFLVKLYYETIGFMSTVFSEHVIWGKLLSTVFRLLLLNLFLRLK